MTMTVMGGGRVVVLLFVCVCVQHPTPASAFWSIYSGWTGEQLPPEDVNVNAMRLHHAFRPARGMPGNVNWFAKSVVERWNEAAKKPEIDTFDLPPVQ